MREMIKLSILMLLLLPLTFFGQGNSSTKQPTKKTVAIDQNGKEYTLDDLAIKPPVKRSGSGVRVEIAGMFRLYFQSESTVPLGFLDKTPVGTTTLGDQRINVLVQVCKDLSVLLGNKIIDNPAFQPDISPKDGKIDEKYIDLQINGSSTDHPSGGSTNLLDTKYPSISPTLMLSLIHISEPTRR